MRYLIAIPCLLASLASAQPATAQMQYPLSAVAAESGTIYVADRNLPGVWKIEDNKLSRFFEGSKRYRTPLYARHLSPPRTPPLALLAGQGAPGPVPAAAPPPNLSR